MALSGFNYLWKDEKQNIEAGKNKKRRRKWRL